MNRRNSLLHCVLTIYFMTDDFFQIWVIGISYNFPIHTHIPILDVSCVEVSDSFLDKILHHLFGLTTLSQHIRPYRNYQFTVVPPTEFLIFLWNLQNYYRASVSIFYCHFIDDVCYVLLDFRLMHVECNI